MKPLALPIRGLLLALALAVLTGCPREARIGGQRPGDEVIAELRRDNRAMRQQIDELNEQLEAQRRQIEAMQQRDGRSVAADVPVPQFVSVRFERYSGFLDTDGDGRVDTLRLYLHTLDQGGRFIPIAGHVAVQVVAVEAGREPRVLLEETIEPAAFARAYRSGFTGTHYTVQLPLPEDWPTDLPSAIVHVQITDTTTGLTARREATMHPRNQRR